MVKTNTIRDKKDCNATLSLEPNPVLPFQRSDKCLDEIFLLSVCSGLEEAHLRIEKCLQ